MAVLADFPRRTAQDATLKAQNERLLKRFAVQGFPTVLLFGPEPTGLPPEVLAEDAVIGARKLGLAPERVRITPVAEVFAR